MNLWTWLRGGKKSILDFSAEELQREQRLLLREKNSLIKKMERLAREKQEIFQKGASKKSPELRRALAQDYEIKTAEEQMTARSLNIKGKELLTVARIRMVRESQGDAKKSRLLQGLNERDMLELSRLINDDEVTREMYEDKLSEILELSRGEAKPEEQLTDAGRKLMEVWQQLDDGEISDDKEAFEKAETALRKQTAASTETNEET
jgi:hypothetical protein